MIDRIIAEAIELCRSEEVDFDDVAQKVVGPMRADVAVSKTLSREVQTDQQAKQLLIEMLNNHLPEMDFTMLDAVDSLAEVVRNIAYHSDAILPAAVIAGIPEYETLIAERTAKYGETGD